MEANGFSTKAKTLTPDDSESDLNHIPAKYSAIALGANVNGTTDFVTLPRLSEVEVGHKVMIVSNSAGCEVRCKAGSDEKINNVNCGASTGGISYALPASDVHYFIKLSDTAGWMGHGFTELGAVVAAIVPAAGVSLSPSLSPSTSPSLSPSVSPSLSPSLSPSVSPSASPT